MSRAYRGVRPKHNQVYSVGHVMSLYKVCRNTLTNWEKAGLLASPGEGVKLYRGGELARFHEERTAKNRSDLCHGEFLCVSCKHAVTPDPELLGYCARRPLLAQGTCPECGAVVMKILHETECTALKKAANTNTAPEFQDEVNVTLSARIGKIRDFYSRKPPTVNDRILYMWETYAGRYDPKTTAGHLVAIREFEMFFEARCFSKLSRDDVACYRNALLKRAKVGDLSLSTIRHRASQLKAFVTWLRKQKGFMRMPADLAECLELPKRVMQKPSSQRVRDYPKIEEAEALLDGMPSASLVQRRDRAIFALSCACGFRAAALVSMRRRHIDMTTGRVHHDETSMRVKNGKGFLAVFFPRTEAFQTVVHSYVAELDGMGALPEDALFASMQDLALMDANLAEDRKAYEPMASSSAVTEAFKIACLGTGKHYTPHSSRDMLAALGEELYASPADKKAWSLTLGHSDVRTTTKYYGKMTDNERIARLDSLSKKGLWSNDDKDLMLDYHDHKLMPGSSEFLRAEKLVEQRRQGRMAKSNGVAEFEVIEDE
jgi:integrase